MSAFPSISVERLYEIHGTCGVDLIDVRTPAEFREMHSIVARNVPLDVLDPHATIAERNDRGDEPLYLICRGGNRSRQACQAFIDAGYANVINVDGGTLAWNEAGLPVNRGKKSISLDRQTPIAIGFLVTVGVMLGYLVHPYGFALSGVMGGGLMYAGLTDTCLMAMVLARMPWNRTTPRAATPTSATPTTATPTFERTSCGCG